MQTSPVISLVQQDWKSQLRNALRTGQDLANVGLIEPTQVLAYDKVLDRYPLLLTPYYAALIDRSDPRCPIRRQCVPDLLELDNGAAFLPDPLDDKKHQPAPRITHRYAHRVLIHLTPNCSMNCRYCFRKTLLGEDRAEFFDGEVTAALEYIGSHPELDEVIFSGGDPFLANEKLLASTLKTLSSFPHLKRVRFHTRVPVTLPMRVDAPFAQLLKSHGLPSTVVTHFNHPKELTDEACAALSCLRSAGHVLLNQSVLLSGVNDNVEVLKKLSEEIFAAGVVPYYLHHPDRAQGTAHFDLSRREGLAIHEQMRRLMPGYLVPRYVWDDPNHPFKKNVD